MTANVRQQPTRIFTCALVAVCGKPNMFFVACAPCGRLVFIACVFRSLSAAESAWPRHGYQARVSAKMTAERHIDHRASRRLRLGSVHLVVHQRLDFQARAPEDGQAFARLSRRQSQTGLQGVCPDPAVHDDPVRKRVGLDDDEDRLSEVDIGNPRGKRFGVRASGGKSMAISVNAGCDLPGAAPPSYAAPPSCCRCRWKVPRPNSAAFRMK